MNQFCTRTVFLVLAAASVSACAAKQLPGKGPAECVGRLALTLPGAADVASMSSQQFFENSGKRIYKFDDGEVAFYSHFQYGGNVAITKALTQQESARLLDKQRARFGVVQDAIASGKMRAGNGPPLQLKKLDASDSATGWRIFNESKYSLVAFPWVEGHAVAWMLSGTPELGPRFEQYLKTFRSGARARAALTVPAGKGVCMPHIFIQDDGDDAAGRLVAATYRLRDHPDVTIMLKDASATSVPLNVDPEKYTAIYQANFFWTQDYQRAKSLKSLLHGKHNKVKLAGQDGVETMFRFEREANGEDFGYLAVVRGDPKAAVDSPDIMLYVIREAQNAKNKGVAPLDQDAFFSMAKSIAASVKHRDAR